jgi:branched-chain amino acid transport system substrate-binding protein
MTEGAKRSTMRRPLGAVALVAALAMLAAACGGGGRDDNSANSSTPGSSGGSDEIVNGSNCPGSLTTGVSGDTIKLGTSLPQSGVYSAFSAILKGEQAYFDYLNAQGGVEVAGKKYKIDLVDKDDAYQADKTVANVRDLVSSENVFALFNTVGTKNNLAIRDYLASQCVPDLLAATGAPQWGNKQYPWVLGTYLVPYPLEMKAFVDYLQEKKPDATIAVLRANDDFGQAYAETLQELVKGTKLKIVGVEQYDAEGSETGAQVTKLAQTKADAFVVGATLLACPDALTNAANSGWKPITYMSGTCVSKVLLSLAGAAADGVITVTPLLDPSDPKNDSNAAMKLYKTNVKKYSSDADVSDGIVGYGWSAGALMAEILHQSPKLDRVSVMNTARTLTAKDVGLQLPGAEWVTSADDWFLGEQFQVVRYDQKAGHTVAIGDLTKEEGQAEKLSPQSLLNG